MAEGIPVVVVSSGGVPVNPADRLAPLMTVAGNGLGVPITLTPHGAPFVIDGLDTLSALSSDDGANLTDDDDTVMEVYDGRSA